MQRLSVQLRPQAVLYPLRLIPNALEKLEFRLRQSLGVRRSHAAPNPILKCVRYSNWWPICNFTNLFEILRSATVGCKRGFHSFNFISGSLFDFVLKLTTKLIIMTQSAGSVRTRCASEEGGPMPLRIAHTWKFSRKKA